MPPKCNNKPKEQKAASKGQTLKAADNPAATNKETNTDNQGNSSCEKINNLENESLSERNSERHLLLTTSEIPIVQSSTLRSATEDTTLCYPREETTRSPSGQPLSLQLDDTLRIPKLDLYPSRTNITNEP